MREIKTNDIFEAMRRALYYELGQPSTSRTDVSNALGQMDSGTLPQASFGTGEYLVYLHTQQALAELNLASSASLLNRMSQPAVKWEIKCTALADRYHGMNRKHVADELDRNRK